MEGKKNSGIINGLQTFWFLNGYYLESEIKQNG
jgi:hypothetical protein